MGCEVFCLRCCVLCVVCCVLCAMFEGLLLVILLGLHFIPFFLMRYLPFAVGHASHATQAAPAARRRYGQRRQRRSQVDVRLARPPPRVCDVVRRYGSLALLVSKSYFECNVLEIILERKQVKLCEIPAIIYLTKQKWEVMYTWRRYFILLIR